MLRQVTARYASKSLSLVFSTKLAVCSCWASLPRGSSAARTCLLLVLHTVIEVLLSKSASVLAWLGLGLGLGLGNRNHVEERECAVACLENKLAQPSASWLSGGCFQRQSMPQAAPSSGPPRPISRLAYTGRPQPCFRHRCSPSPAAALCSSSRAELSAPRRTCSRWSARPSRAAARPARGHQHRAER